MNIYTMINGKCDKLLERIDAVPLLFIAGKGGTGRTTVVANLARRSLLKGQSVLHIAVDSSDGRLQLEASDHANIPKANYQFFTLDGRECFKEYFISKFPLKFLLQKVINNTLFDICLNVAPGLKELAVLGKIVHEYGRGHWNKIIVDLPASGHALEYFKMPLTAERVFRAGLIGRESLRIIQLLRDKTQSALVPVGLPEELAVSELIEFLDANQRGLNLDLALIVMNRFPMLEISPEDVKEALARVPDGSENTRAAEMLEAYRARRNACLEEITPLVAACGEKILYCQFSTREEMELSLLEEFGN